MRDEMRYEDAYEEGIVPCDWLDKAVAEEIQDYYECSFTDACYKMQEMEEEQKEAFIFLREKGFSFDDAMDYAYDAEILSYEKGEVTSLKIMTLLGEQILVK